MSSNYRSSKESLPMSQNRSLLGQSDAGNLQGQDKPCISAAPARVGLKRGEKARSYDEIKDTITTVKSITVSSSQGAHNENSTLHCLSSATGLKLVMSPPFAGGSFGAVGPARVVGDTVDKLYAAKTISLPADKQERATTLATIKNEVNIMMGITSLAPKYVFEAEDKVMMLMAPMHGDAFSFIVDAAGSSERNRTLRALFTHAMMHEVAGSLAFLHGQGITHRDVKLENIMIHSDGRIVLGDFGLTAQKTLFDDTCGTLEFQAPEALRSVFGGAAYSGPETDIWALGVTVVDALLCENMWQNEGWNLQNFISGKDSSREIFAAAQLAKVEHWGVAIQPIQDKMRANGTDQVCLKSEVVTDIIVKAGQAGGSTLGIAVMMMEAEPSQRPSAARIAELSADPSASPSKTFSELGTREPQTEQKAAPLGDNFKLPGMSLEQKAALAQALSTMPSDAKVSFAQAKQSTAHLAFTK